jgi:hypothetical protein
MQYVKGSTFATGMTNEEIRQAAEYLSDGKDKYYVMPDNAPHDQSGFMGIIEEWGRPFIVQLGKGRSTSHVVVVYGWTYDYAPGFYDGGGRIARILRT